MDLLTRGQAVVYPRPAEMLWLLKEWSEDARPRLGHSVPLLYAGSFLCELVMALTRPTAGQQPERNSEEGAGAHQGDPRRTDAGRVRQRLGKKKGAVRR